MKIEFPILNISNPDWSFLTDAIMMDDSFYYLINRSNFVKYFEDQEFVDLLGNCFKIVGLEKFRLTWRLFVPLIPNVYKREIYFISLNKQKNFKEVKDYYLDRIDSLGDAEHLIEWKEEIQKAYNFSSLIKGYID